MKVVPFCMQGFEPRGGASPCKMFFFVLFCFVFFVLSVPGGHRALDISEVYQLSCSIKPGASDSDQHRSEMSTREEKVESCVSLLSLARVTRVLAGRLLRRPETVFHCCWHLQVDFISRAIFSIFSVEIFLSKQFLMS